MIDFMKANCLYRAGVVCKHEGEIYSDRVCVACWGLDHARQLAAIQKAQRLGLKVPNDPYYIDFFLESTDSLIKRHSEKWVREHATMLNSEWEYVATLL